MAETARVVFPQEKPLRGPARDNSTAETALHAPTWIRGRFRIFAQGAAPHSACLVAGSKAALDEFSAPSESLFAIVSSDPIVVGLDGLLLRLPAIPVALACLFLFWNVTGNFIFTAPLDDRAAVIALVGNQLLDPLDIDLRIPVGMQLGLAPN